MPDATTSSHGGLALAVAVQRARLVRAWRAAMHGEAEALRRVRIATRRLREVIGFVRQMRTGHAGKRVTRDLRRISRAFGRARELAVAREDLERAARTHGWTADRVGLVSRWLEREASDAVREMRVKLRRVDIRALDARLATLAADIDALATAPRRRSRLPAALVRRATRVERARARCGALYAPEQLHALRIAIKKLRYVTELSRTVTGADLDHLVSQLKRQQGRLGRLHDRQVLLAEVQACAAAGSGPGLTRLSPVIEALECDCRRWHGAAVASLGELDATVAEALRAAATLARLDRGRPARSRLVAAPHLHRPVVPAARHRRTA